MKQVGLFPGLRNLVQPTPETNDSIDFKYSGDPMKAVTCPILIPPIQSILKFQCPSSLDYRASNELLVISALYEVIFCTSVTFAINFFVTIVSFDVT